MANLKPFDPQSVIVIILTVVLFAEASFVKGSTHDLFIETGVLLVSIKLIFGHKRMCEPRRICSSSFCASKSY
jgi:hypothetical protein